MSKSEKSRLLRGLKNRSIYHEDLPEEYKEDKDIIECERSIGIRRVGKRGFDVINQTYFVSEIVEWLGFKENIRYFNDFDTFYDYLNGDIYDNSCYYKDYFLKTEKSLDKQRLFDNKSFINYDITNYGIEPADKEERINKEKEKKKERIKKWIDKFIACNTLKKLIKVTYDYNKSTLNTKYGLKVDFFFWQYIYHDIEDEERFNIVMQYMSLGRYPESNMIKPLCHVYGADKVLNSYCYSSDDERRAFNRRKKKLEEYVASIKTDDVMDGDGRIAYYDPLTHYYCEHDSNNVYKYFESFDDFAAYRKRDFTNTDLTKDLLLNYDFSNCLLDSTTKLSFKSLSSLRCEVKKRYDGEIFEVYRTWLSVDGKIVKSFTNKFKYFCDFVAFLRGDLSGADLILCDGLKNLTDVSDINFTDVEFSSDVCNRFGIKYEKWSFDEKKFSSLFISEEIRSESISDNSIEWEQNLINKVNSNMTEADFPRERLFCISNLMLVHNLKNYNIDSSNDIKYVVRKTIIEMLKELDAKSTLLIDTDISPDYRIFEIFIKELKKEVSYRQLELSVIFVPGSYVNRKYAELIDECDMYFLQNDILFKDSDSRWSKIENNELNILSSDKIREKLRAASIVILGGNAFSGCDDGLNSENIVKKDCESGERIKFRNLYQRLLSFIPDRNMIVFTHSPMTCWNDKNDCHTNYTYINSSNNDGTVNIYSNKQSGFGKTQYLKWVEIDTAFDYFSDFKDGIYKITKEDLCKFYKGKNIKNKFKKEVNVIYMLKKQGYYCFIHETKSGCFDILNGGEYQRLKKSDINYYFNNMDLLISKIKVPLDKYTNVQKTVSDEIKMIGGSGIIHGCIVDIDYYNHVYVNPGDLRITGYWESNTICKKEYPSIPDLLKEVCSSMYQRYIELRTDNMNCLQILTSGIASDVGIFTEKKHDIESDRKSREFNKLQKLYSNVLAIWYE